MRVLVTGGAGFVGSHLCERLLADGDHVVCLDDLSTGCRNNVSALAAHPHFELMVHDVAEPFVVEADRIYNLACPASPVHYQKDPVKTIKTNVLGTLHVASLAQKTGARVLQASTSEVYGDPLVHPQPESYYGNVNTFGPRACYDEGKRVAESLLFAYREQEGIDIRIARIFNTYGPRMLPDDGRVVSSFIVCALRGEPLTVFGSGLQTRSFCYVDDLVAGLTALMASDARGPVNLGNPAELSMVGLAQEVIRLTQSCSTVCYAPLPADDPQRRQPDITLAQTTLGWSPHVPLATGLRRTIAYFRTRG